MLRPFTSQIKTYSSFIWVMLVCISSHYSQSSSGVHFFQGSWEQALGEAREQRKLIFLHAYTDWCTYCKTMYRNTLKESESVADFFNTHFINVKMNMEIGMGPELAYKYDVSAFPTSLFIDYLGRLIYKDQGYRSPEEFINIGYVATDPAHNRTTLALSYKMGKSNPEELLQYAYLLELAKEDYREVADQYFNTQSEKELLTEKNWEAIQILTYDIHSNEFQYLIKKKKRFEKMFGRKEVEAKISTLLKKNVITSVYTGQEHTFQEALSMAKNYMDDSGELASRLRLTLAAARKEWQDYAHKAISHYEKFPSTNAEELHLAAEHFLKHILQPHLLTSSVLWARQAVALENSYLHNYTYASLLLKVGQYKEAKEIANKSVYIARTEGVNPERSLKLLKKIEAVQP